MERRTMVDRTHSHLSITQQCRLLGIHRSGLYYQPCGESEENLQVLRLLDEQYFRTPFYGVRKLTAWLLSLGHRINRKRVARLMGLMGWRTLYRGRRTTIRSKSHPVYPYLLKGLAITRVNQVWAMDITYIPMRRGFLYLTAIIDVASRYVVGWSLSNSMSAEWCTEVMREAIATHGTPEIVNTDQGSQFTSEEFTSQLKASGIAISMDSKGRAIDNIFIERFWRSLKYEHIYLQPADDGVALYAGVRDYIDFYNTERIHQSLGYQTPLSHYQKAA
jgi:putative transposase